MLYPEGMNRETVFDETEERYQDEPKRSMSKLPLSQQEKAIVELHDTIAQLSNKLKNVLTPIPVSDEDKLSDATSTAVSPLAEQMESNNRGIYRANKKLRDLIELIEC